MKLFIFKNGELFLEKTLYPESVEVIGRSRAGSIILKDPRISREHAKIFFEDGKWRIKDLGSQNGILLHKREVRFEAMVPEEQYEVGPFLLKIQEVTNAEKALENTDAFLTAIAVKPIKPLAKETVTLQKPRPTTSNDAPKVLKNFIEDDKPKDDLGLTTDEPKSLPRLVVVEGEKSGQEFRVDQQEEVFFGTSATGTQKATIVSPRDGTFIIRAEQSFPEVKIDGVPIKERELENHDIIEIGKSKVQFVTGQSKVQARKTGVAPRPSAPIKQQNNLFSNLSNMDWRTLVIAGLLVGTIMTFVMTKKIAEKEAKPVQTASDEKQRLRVLHLSQAQDLVRLGKFDEAEEKIKNILQSIDPGNADAKKLALQIQKIKKQKGKGPLAQSEVEKKTKGVIRDLVEDGDLLLEKNKFEDARAAYEKALELDPSNLLAKAAMDHLDTEQQEFDRENIAKKKTSETLEKIYNQAIDEFEKGRKSDAKKLLTEILKYPDHKRYSSAKRMLEKLGASTDVLPADDSGESSSAPITETPLPKEEGADNETKAKEAYRKALTYLEVTNDPALAIDQFELVIKLLPDPNNEYHQKAKRKMKQLQLEP